MDINRDFINKLLPVIMNIGKACYAYQVRMVNEINKQLAAQKAVYCLMERPDHSIYIADRILL